MGVQGEEFGAEAGALWRSSADGELSRHVSSHFHHLLSVCQKVWNPVMGGCWDGEVYQLAWADGVESKAVVQEEHPDICSAAFQVLQSVVQG